MKNLLTAWSRLFVGALRRAGVEDVVIAPGSRNTPLIVAAVRENELRVHSILDERAAAFFALGQARVTERPTAVFCTSGTAGAHFYPAVLEAEASRLPLIVVTADRPFELVDVGAPQAMDQRGLFGRHVRAEIELGLPDAHPQALDGLARSAARAVHYARRGPVHVNFRARKPLEAFDATTEAEQALERAVDARLSNLVHIDAARTQAGPVAAIVEALHTAQRPLVVAGPMRRRHAAVARFAEHIGAPLLADVASQLRSAEVISTADVLLTRDDLVPDLVIRFGAPPTPTAWPKFFARHRDVPTFIIDETADSEPFGGATQLVVGDIDATASALLEADARAEPDWLNRWREQDRRVRELIAQRPWSEASVTRTVAAALPEDASIFVGNSLAIRHLDLYADPFVQPVLHQRGVNGIDGMLAGAAGAASRSEGPLAVLIGDVTFAHDVGSLSLLVRAASPVVVVVIDNDGGRIFEMLPLMNTEPPPAVLACFTTPPRIDLESAAKAFGVAYRGAEDQAALGAALAYAFQRGGATVVHARVPPSDAAPMLKALREEVRS
ncbi:MAG: 2-succinyl-5-enolpyruvyl-6-hydroxy-3-cyclohexene-1-carboxylic-acid synthase [Deltaproteobacteria bacterium]